MQGGGQFHLHAKECLSWECSSWVHRPLHRPRQFLKAFESGPCLLPSPFPDTGGPDMTARTDTGHLVRQLWASPHVPETAQAVPVCFCRGRCYPRSRQAFLRQGGDLKGRLLQRHGGCSRVGAAVTSVGPEEESSVHHSCASTRPPWGLRCRWGLAARASWGGSPAPQALAQKLSVRRMMAARVWSPSLWEWAFHQWMMQPAHDSSSFSMATSP